MSLSTFDIGQSFSFASSFDDESLVASIVGESNQSRTNSGNQLTSSTPQAQKKTLPTGDEVCSYYLKGTCLRLNCKFFHGTPEDVGHRNSGQFPPNAPNEVATFVAERDTNKEPILCQKYIEGDCKRGSACKFVHLPDEIRPIPTHVCAAFLKGNCDSANVCLALHGTEEQLIRLRCTGRTMYNPKTLAAYEYIRRGSSHHGDSTPDSCASPKASSSPKLPPQQQPLPSGPLRRAHSFTNGTANSQATVAQPSPLLPPPQPSYLQSTGTPGSPLVNLSLPPRAQPQGVSLSSLTQSASAAAAKNSAGAAMQQQQQILQLQQQQCMQQLAVTAAKHTAVQQLLSIQNQIQALMAQHQGIGLTGGLANEVQEHLKLALGACKAQQMQVLAVPNNIQMQTVSVHPMGTQPSPLQLTTLVSQPQHTGMPVTVSVGNSVNSPTLALRGGAATTSTSSPFTLHPVAALPSQSHSVRF